MRCRTCLLVTLLISVAFGIAKGQGEYVDKGITALGLSGALMSRPNIRGESVNLEFISGRILDFRASYTGTHGEFRLPVGTFSGELVSYVGKNVHFPVFFTLRCGFINESRTGGSFQLGGSLSLNRKVGKRTFVLPQLSITQVADRDKKPGYTIGSASIGIGFRMHSGTSFFLEVGRRSSSFDHKPMNFVGLGTALAYKPK